MKQISLLTFLFLLFNVLSINAQRACGSAFDLNALQTYNPGLYQQYLNENQAIQNVLNAPESMLMLETVVIPVVVHILHNGEAVGSGRNLSFAQIQSQILVLNEDFRRFNVSSSNTPLAFAPVAADANIEFRLACTDPNGNPTDGITRTQTNITTFDRVPNLDGTPNEMATRIKFTSEGGIDAWNPSSYLNIWVCNLGSNLLGYSQSPLLFATRANTDGVVILSTAFGRTGNVAAPFDRGQTATHEIGHWLSLRHIWGDANCGDDGVGDTPTQQKANRGCPTFPSSTCNNGANGDMFMNYMDYSDDACMNLFTTGQRTRMRAVLLGGERANTNYMFFGATLPTPTATRFLYGNDFRDLKSFTVRNNGILQVNGVGTSRFGNGVPLSGQPVTVQPNCNDIIDLSIETGGQLVIGEGQRVGTMRTGNGSTITIQSGATIRISNSSQLVVQSGSKLTIEENAIIQLDDLNSRITIEDGGELEIKGQFNFSGNGHFRFEQGNIFKLNSNLTLNGAGRTTPIIRMGSGGTITLSNPVALTINNATIFRETGSLAANRAIWLRNGATFRANNVVFDGQSVVLDQAAFVEVDDPFDANADPDDVDYGFTNCRFQNIKLAVRLDVPYATSTPFDWRNVNLEFVGCQFDNCQALNADRSYITLFDNCTLTNSTIDISHTYWLNLRNTQMRSTFGTAGTAIKATHVGHFWFRENCLIDNFGTGIDASSGLNWNIIMTDGSTIQQCATGIHLNGSQFNATVDLGILHMDCARMIQNETAIRGSDIIFSAYARNPNFNTFTQSPNNPNGRYIESVFEKRNETDLWFHGNFWDNTTPPSTPVNAVWSFLQKTIPQSPGAPWNGVFHLNDTRINNPNNTSNTNCGGVTLRDAQDDPLSKKTIVKINGVFRDVKIQQDAGLSRLRQNQLANALALFAPVAEIPSNVRDTASPTVKYFVDVARAMTLKLGVELRSSSKYNWLPETLVETPNDITDALMLSPNPANTIVEMKLTSGKYQLRVYNTIGQSIFEQNTEGYLSVDVSKWTNGIYLFEVTDKATNKRQQCKIVVQH
jgi:Pregnancy-associated plasma protein-A/Secretion system C-terminal sorting domain